jgi:hypothetical protein
MGMIREMEMTILSGLVIPALVGRKRLHRRNKKTLEV